MVLSPTVEQLMAVQNPRMTVPGFTPPEGLKARDYQIIDATFLLLRERGIIGEYPAAGKKVIAILAALKAFSLQKAENALIVSLGADVDQWAEEFDRWTDGISYEIHSGERRKRRRNLESAVQPDIRLCSYQTAVADSDVLLNRHSIITLDEVSYIRNPEAATSGHVRAICAPTHAEQFEFFRRLVEESQLSENPRKHLTMPHLDLESLNAKYVWGLTATPIETGPVDLFSLFWAIHGVNSPLGTRVVRYKQLFCNTKKLTMRIPTGKRTRDGRIKRRKLTVEVVTGVREDTKEDLKELIREWYIRHPWEVVQKELPPLEVEPVKIELTKAQKDRYKEISQGDLIYDFYRERKGREAPRSKRVEYALRLFYQLRCCDGLTSLPQQNKRDSCKLQWTMKQLTGELGGEKVIIYSRFYQPLDDLAPKLDELDMTWVRMSGDLGDDHNTKARREFMKPAGPQFMLMTDVGSYALNLQIARYGIAYNRKYNPKKLEQLHGRNRRPQFYDDGSPIPPEEQDTVVWLHPICIDTSEEAQWDVIVDRSELSAELLGDEEEIFQRLDPEQQLAILSHGHGSG